MKTYEPLQQLPFDIVRDWRAQLLPAIPTTGGAFRLVDARRSYGGYEEQRVTAQVLDENGFPIPNVRVAFSFSTADSYTLPDNIAWMPPAPYKAHLTYTGGSGQADLVLGPEGVVKEGEAGGVTVYCLEPEYASDVVTGCGMLHNHVGLVLTFQLRRTGILPIAERLAAIEARLAALEAA